MVAMVPFDWQAHDTYFVVAHFHYVLVGGMVFPLFAAFYYWAPAFSRRPLSERLGKLGFWLMFVGFNVAFLPMHMTGLIGMPRRVYTYPAELGWGTLNHRFDRRRVHVRGGCAGVPVRPCPQSPADAVASVPAMCGAPARSNGWRTTSIRHAQHSAHVTSREPLWDQPVACKATSRQGRYYLPGTATGRRETIVTSPIEAAPQYLLRLPGPGWTPFLAAIFTAAFFLLSYGEAGRRCARAAAFSPSSMMFVWMWESDPASAGRVDIGGGIKLPTYVDRPVSHSWWAMVILMLVAGSLYLSCVFSYLYLWTVSPAQWPTANAGPLPNVRVPVIAGTFLCASAITVWLSDRLLPLGCGRLRFSAALGLAIVFGCASLAIDVHGHWSAGWRPQLSGYGALVGMGLVLRPK